MDIENDRSISAFYFFPKQRVPHRSHLLRGVKHPPRVLDSSDYNHVQRGGRGRGRGGPLGDSSRRDGYPGRGPSYHHDIMRVGGGRGAPTYGRADNGYGYWSEPHSNGHRGGDNYRAPFTGYGRGGPPRGGGRGGWGR